MSAKHKLIAIAYQGVVNLLAAAAFAALVLTPLRIPGYVLAALALAAVAYRGRRGGFTQVIAPSLLITAGLLGDYYRHTAGVTVPVTIAGILLITLIASQPIVPELTRQNGIRAANLPGYQTEAGLPISIKHLNASYLGMIGLAGVFAAAGINAWSLAALALIATAGTGVDALEALRIRSREKGRRSRVRTAIEKLAPEFAVHFSAPDNTEYHVEMWRAYFERIGVPWMIITREPSPFRKLAVASAKAGTPVVFCVSQEQLDEVVTPSLKAVFYVNNGMKNTHMVRFTDLTHIFVGHGDSEKPAGYNPVAGMYTRIFVPGQASIDRYHMHGVDIPTARFDIVGRPQAEGVTVTATHIRDVAPQTVLYSTTWTSPFADGNHCSLPVGDKIVRALLARGATVIFRPHPYVSRNPTSARQAAAINEILAEDRARTGRAHVFGAEATKTTSLVDCVNRADALITDVSGVVTEALYSLKPLALTNMLGESGAAYASAFPLSKAAYVIDADANNMDAVLDDLLNTDSLEPARKALKSHYLGDFGPAYADGFFSAARRYIKK
jgi:hypothetical protein